MTQRLLLPIDPSFQTGFASSKEEALFPSLWDGVTYAAFFDMGPSQSVIDYSGRQTRQTSGGPTVFARSNRGWALEHDNTTDNTDLGAMDDIVGASNVSVLIGKEKTDGTLRAGSVFGNSDTTTNRRCGFLGPWTDGEFYFDFGGSTAGSTRVDTGNHGAGSPSFADDDIACTTGSRGMEIWQNGLRIAHTSANPTRSTNSADTFQLGRHAGIVSDLLYYRYIVVYNRQLTPEEIEIVAHHNKAMLMVKRPFYAIVGLATEHPRSESDSLGITDSATSSGLFPRSLSDTISFTQDIVQTGDQSRFVSDSLGISDSENNSVDPLRSLTDTLSLTDEGVDLTDSVTVTDNLVITDEVLDFLILEDRQVPENTLNLTQEVLSSLTPILEDELELTQEITVIGPIVVSVDQNLTLQDGVRDCFGAPWSAIEVEDTLSFQQFPGIGYQLSITHTLSFTETATQTWGADQVMGLIQIVSASVSTPAIVNTLELTQTLETQNVLIRSLSHTAFLDDSFSFYIDSSCRRKQYNRFEGSGSAVGVPLPPLTFDANFVLESLVGTKTTVELRNPETDDVYRIGYNRINRETQGGELNIFSDPDWPQIETLLFTIVALGDGSGGCPDKIGSVFQFFQDTLGQEILLHDWEGVTWRGVITTPNEVAVEDRDGWWTVTFEFEGVAQDGAQNDQDLGIAQTIGLLHEHNRIVTENLGLTDVGRSSIFNEVFNDDLSLSHSVVGTLETIELNDDTDGSGASGINGTTPDTGSSTWTAHANFRADGTMSSGVNSGAYYPFIPSNGFTYDIQWNVRSMSMSEGLQTTCFIGEGVMSDPTDVGATAYGLNDPTTLKAGFLLWLQGGAQVNSCSMGDVNDGQADTVVFSDATLKAEATEIDLRLILDTTGGTNNWTATWYAKDILDSVWTEVRSESGILDENIGAVGWATNNTTTTITMDNINVTKNKAVTS